MMPLDVFIEMAAVLRESQDWSTLKSLSQVSRAVSSVAQAALFQHVVVRDGDGVGELWRLHDSMNDVLKYAKRVTLRAVQPDWYDLRALKALFSKAPQVHEVRFEYVSMTTRLCAVVPWKSVTALEFRECRRMQNVKSVLNKQRVVLHRLDIIRSDFPLAEGQALTAETVGLSVPLRAASPAQVMACFQWSAIKNLTLCCPALPATAGLNKVRWERLETLTIAGPTCKHLFSSFALETLTHADSGVHGSHVGY
jgi:hypothetical protein